MLSTNDLILFLQNHRQTFKSNYRIARIGLIGSFARREQTDKSDIDLLVEFEPDTDNISDKKMRLRYLLRSSFNRDVDICREKYIKPYIKSYILKEAIYV
jgi:predicted nucleotidyltransferase